MFDKILQIIKENIRKSNYVVTLHAEEEIDEDFLSIFDVEHAILNGGIEEKQKDFNTGESKYRIKGITQSFKTIEIIVKISPNGKLVIITVYSLNIDYYDL